MNCLDVGIRSSLASVQEVLLQVCKRYDSLSSFRLVQPHGLGVIENMVKEAAEEAGIPENLAHHAVPAGAVSYTAAYRYKCGHSGLKRDVLFVFDLDLPEDFEPVAMDGEVESFQLMKITDVIDVVAFSDRYKDNCNLVLIDFFFRHGLLDPGGPGYLRLLSGIRKGECA
jgi:8-oxo-dGTP pyrophosphatase MutT (NUDIX family)